MRKLMLPILLVCGTTFGQDDAMIAGLTALRMNDHRTAEEVFTHAVDKAPDDLRTWYYRGVNRLAVGDIKGALHDLDRVIELSPTDAHGLLRRAEARAQAGSVADARRDLNTLLLHQPTGPAAEQALEALGKFALAEGDMPGAHAHFDALVQIAPYSATALADRGVTRVALGREVEALADLELALDRDPTLSAAHAHIGIILLRQGRKQEACHALFAAHSLGDRSVEELLLVHCDR
jgi:Flp pilus assembly protein TadD